MTRIFTHVCIPHIHPSIRHYSPEIVWIPSVGYFKRNWHRNSLQVPDLATLHEVVWDEGGDKPTLGREGGVKVFHVGRTRGTIISNSLSLQRPFKYEGCVCVCVHKSLKYNLLPCKGLLEIQTYYPTHKFSVSWHRLGGIFCLSFYTAPSLMDPISCTVTWITNPFITTAGSTDESQVV